MNDWQAQLETEFETALRARANNNEGQARVCARRAAGIAIRESLARRGVRAPSKSAYDLLNLIKVDLPLPADIALIVEHLTLRVTEDFKLPVEADLISESRSLCRWLLPDWETKSP